MRFFLSFIFSSVFCLSITAQTTIDAGKNAGIMFYNTENLFDTRNDSLKDDDEFTPEGSRHWTYSRMRRKWVALSRVIINANAWDAPVIIGLCEVENRWVVNSMLYETGLKNLDYDLVHFESPDNRGIDVAMLYQTTRVKILDSQPIPVKIEGDRPTRDILFAKVLLDNADTLFVLVNHWPSRWGGAVATHPKRRLAAKTVRHITDSLFCVNQQSKVIIMGDFNEPPQSNIFKVNLAIGAPSDDKWLVSPALDLPAGVGTLKYQHEWSVFDQIIVSRPLLTDTLGVVMQVPQLRIIRLPFLLMQDENYGGEKPFRTYFGYKYQGGYSDHLPVWIDLVNYNLFQSTPQN
jgi:endonuclease/exonuclease/phosphatase family metal-dependent hydrolase